jgi:hypothetical protein
MDPCAKRQALSLYALRSVAHWEGVHAVPCCAMPCAGSGWPGLALLAGTGRTRATARRLYQPVCAAQPVSAQPPEPGLGEAACARPLRLQQRSPHQRIMSSLHGLPTEGAHGACNCSCECARGRLQQGGHKQAWSMHHNTNANDPMQQARPRTHWRWLGGTCRQVRDGQRQDTLR